jgi:K+-transporting ATPase KdpF subunit
MTLLYAIVGGLALLILVYLFIALLKPEKFG